MKRKNNGDLFTIHRRDPYSEYSAKAMTQEQRDREKIRRKVSKRIDDAITKTNIREVWE